MEKINRVQEQPFYGKKLRDAVKDYNARVDHHNAEVDAIQAEERALKSLAVDAPVEELAAIPERRAALGQRRTAATVEAVRLLMEREPMQGPIFEAYAKERGKRQAAYEEAKQRVARVFEDNRLGTHFLQGVINDSCKAEEAAAKSLTNPTAVFNREMQDQIALLRRQI